MDMNTYISVAVNVLVLSVVVFLIAKLLPAIRMKSFATAVVVAVVYSVINILLERLMTRLPMPGILKEAYVIGLILVLLNALMLKVTEMLIRDFKIKNFGWTLLASLLITVSFWLITKYLLPLTGVL
ncbi:MAG: phage holin family protein [Chitinispirillales bacterium]|jgi:putative membrane protein|nr:phage holin family protein [Chitinispirillales bacterium]